MGFRLLIYGWYSDCDNYAGVRGVSRRDRDAFYFDQRIPEPDYMITLECVRDSDEAIGDFPNTGLAYPKCVSDRAMTVLRPLLEPTGIIRRAELESLEFWLYWPSNIVDCLDYETSEIIKMQSGFEQLITPVFRPNVDDAGPVFLVPEFRTQVLFVVDTFLEVAQEAGLRGLEIRQGGGADATVTRIG